MNGAHFDAITDYPQLAHGDVDKRDITKLSTFLKDMVGVGILIPDEDLEDYVREVANLPERTLSDDPRNKDEQREAQRRSPEKEGKTSEVDLYREGGEMHIRGGVARLIESAVFTKEKMEAMGIPEGTLPTGWWIGFQVTDADVWEKVKDGTYSMFSIEGEAKRVEVEDEESDQ